MSDKKQSFKKVVLAYSGGLDTSVIVPWLKNNYNCEVICYCANLGQEDELTGLEEKAIASGASKCYVEDLREEFIADYLYPLLKSGAVYERKYLLGTSVARPPNCQTPGRNRRVGRGRCRLAWGYRQRE